ncbi:MAG: transketolase [Lachnospiraceae bacterium]|jgi:transketolase|nr:transketolase [Lachnospiraceae bacterium]MCI9305944.1 transketolase [Lachnospiraceae bacterium]
MKSTREAAMKAILEMAEQDSRIVVVSPDSMLAARAVPFKERFPERFVEVGIAEQDAVDIAAGLAATGMVPIVITYAGFLTMRACEMIRTFIAYPGLNVKLIGLNAGMLGGEREGVTHQFYEDVGILRSIAGVKILAPADGAQVYHAAKEMIKQEGPVYLRLASGREPVVYEEEEPFTYGRLRELKRYGTDAVIFASGYIMDRALEAAGQLHKEGIETILADVSTIKPIDREGVVRLLQETGGRAVTVEDHNIYGGLGSTVCEVACEESPAKVIRLGLKDQYARSGAAKELLDAYGLSVEDIVNAVKRVRES